VNTPQVLKTLSKHKIKATFFVIGENVKRWPRILEQTHEEGHKIGNHSYTHPHLTDLSQAKVRSEIKKTDRLISPYLSGDKLFRPPYGAHNATVDRIVRSLGYRLVFWNVDTLDWNTQYQPDRWIENGIEQIQSRDSCIILNHDIHKTTADYLDTFIRNINELGNVVFQNPEAL